MTMYRCVFKFQGKSLETESSNGLCAFDHGFWIDQYKELTYGMDAKYWIPPNAIEYVEAIRDSVSEDGNV